MNDTDKKQKWVMADSWESRTDSDGREGREGWEGWEGERDGEWDGRVRRRASDRASLKFGSEKAKKRKSEGE